MQTRTCNDLVRLLERMEYHDAPQTHPVLARSDPPRAVDDMAWGRFCSRRSLSGPDAPDVLIQWRFALEATDDVRPEWERHGDAGMPLRATAARVGTEAKVVVLERRAACREALWHPGDCPMDEEGVVRLAVACGRLVRVLHWRDGPDRVA